MKLDTKALRYLTSDDWRVLTAVEIGSKNHEVVPTPLIIQLSHLRSGSGVHKSISALAKVNLIARTKNAKYDGYRLTYGGLDYLSLHTHLKHSTLYSIGNCIGVGKESDVYVCASPSGTQHILKIHRLGRISFRSIKNNRDYLRHRSSASWMYMSRLAALKEFAFMKVLGENGFRVPEAIAQSRHTVVMGLVDGVPLRGVKKVGDPAGLYAELMEVILKLASYGLIHGDFNEFNIMIKEDEAPMDDIEGDTDAKATARITPVIIDFPQMVSIDHTNAKMYFDRDVKCIKNFFKRKCDFTSNEPGPFFADARKLPGSKTKRLDVQVEASGFSKKMAKELEKYMQEVGADGDGGHDGNNAEHADAYDASDASSDDFSNGGDEDLTGNDGTDESVTLTVDRSLQNTVHE